MTFATYWNPGPIVTHLVDEAAGATNGEYRTLCGARITRDWEAGEDYEPEELNSALVGCARCTASAERIARVAAALEPKS